MNSPDLPMLGCDTLVATSSATAAGIVLFAKNSDRHPDECQHLRTYPACDWPKGAAVPCQYLSVPQARHTYRILGSQPFWLWGFEHGVNEHGVAIGNEAIWTKAPRQTIGLLGMDLIRLGLERGATAEEALQVISILIEEFGPGGSPRHNDPQAPCYDNSFIIADPREAWVLETSGRDWAARRVEGIYSISNTPSIGTEFTAASPGLRNRCVDFARDLGDYHAYPQTSGQTRCTRSRALLQAKAGRITVRDMMAFLRDHGSAGAAPNPDAPSICMHAGLGQTAASMVVELRPNGVTAWCSLSTPCISIFLPMPIDVDVPDDLARGGASFEESSAWWRLRRLLEYAITDWARYSPRIRSHWDHWESNLLRQAAEYQSARREARHHWVNDNVARLLSEIGKLEQELGSKYS